MGTFILLIGVTVGVVATAFVVIKVPDTLPEVRAETSTVTWSDGTEMVKWFNEDRTIIEYDDLPQCSGEPQTASAESGQGEACIGVAVVASEDETFWTNSGIDLKGMSRALVNNVGGGARQGGSTLTQQYVERYFEGGTSSYSGKAREAILALKITQSEDKKVILENYLNTIYFGRGAYGVEAAAKSYFGMTAAQLNYNQAAFIAGIIPSPNRYDKEGSEAWALERWERSIRRMAEQGYITAEQKAAAVYPELGTPGGVVAKKANDRMAGPTGHLIQMVENELIASGEFTDETLRGKGYQITTTFDPAMQNAAVETVDSLRNEQDPAPSSNLHATIVTVDSASGGVRALYGGPDYLATQFNDAVQGRSQPGSTFKPFTLIAGLEEGISLNKTYDGNNSLKLPGWEKPVKNFSGQSFGSTSLLKATAFSVNTVYAELNNEVGPESTAWAAYRAGIKMGKPGLEESQVGEVLNTYPSNVLGSEPVSPVELANAYATLAANGNYTPWHVVDKVLDKEGNVIFDASVKYPAEEGAIEEEAALGATYAMQEVVQMKGASGNPAKKLERPVAGKTGTSSDNISAWFAGYTPQLATVVGLFQTPDDGSQGNAEITPFGEWSRKSITGGAWPVVGWTEYMTKAMGDLPVEEFPEYTPSQSLQTEMPSEEPSETEEPQEPEVSEAPAAPDNVGVPYVIGNGRDAAISTLKGLGFVVHETPAFSATVPAGNVISASPANGSIPRGSTVSIVVSAGPENAPSPTPDPMPTPGPSEGVEGGGPVGP